MKISSLVYIALFLSLGCKPVKQTQTLQEGKYYEELSGLRPTVKAETVSIPDKPKRDPTANAEPVLTVNKQLDAILDSIDRINLTRKFVEGYTIQVYSGLKREDALNVRKQLTITLPNLNSELQYVQPNFRVKSGKYFNRLEAEKDYQQVKQYFQSAILVPDKIAIN